MRTIFHIDVNSAYLSWTSVENLKTGNGPDLREIPAIIGGDQKTRHGVVLAKSIPAKKFGIHTGEPVVNALKKCPNLVMAPPNHDLYHAYSCRMMDFLHSLTPDIEQVSIDECFLDFTGISHRYPSPYAAARYIKDEIHSRMHSIPELPGNPGNMLPVFPDHRYPVPGPAPDLRSRSDQIPVRPVLPLLLYMQSD